MESTVVRQLLPAAVSVAIPKKTGGERILGIPTVSDRIAQRVVKLEFGSQVDFAYLNEANSFLNYLPLIINEAL